MLAAPHTSGASSGAHRSRTARVASRSSGCWIAAAVVVALLVSGCSNGDATSAAGQPSGDIGAGVHLISSPEAFRAGTRVTAQTAAVPEEVRAALAGEDKVGAGAVFAAGPGVEITPTVQPARPVTVELPVDESLYADLPTSIDSAVLVLHKHDNDPVEVLVGTLDRARSVVRVQTSSLSWFGSLWPSVKALTAELGQIVNGSFSSLIINAPRPQCDDEKIMKDAGWSVRSDKGPTVRWCLGTVRAGVTDNARLQVVDAARYALLVSFGKSMQMTGTSNNGDTSFLPSQALTESINPNQTVLLPGGSRTFSVTLQPGTGSVLKTEFDNFSQSLATLQLCAELILAFAEWPVKWAGASKPAVKEVVSAIDAAQCTPALLDLASDPSDNGRVGKMLSACLDAKLLTGVLGKIVGSVVFAALGVLAAVVSFAWTSLNSLVDLVKGDSDYKLSISRRGPQTPTGQNGQYSRYTNPRFGFSLDLPSVMPPDPAPANGDGQTFRNPAGTARVTVSGSNNVLGDTAASQRQSWLETLRDEGVVVSYDSLKADRFALSGRAGATVWYVRGIVGTGHEVTLVWQYPVEELLRWDAAVTRSVSTLRTGDLSKPY